MEMRTDKPGAGEAAAEKPLHRDRIALGMVAAVASFFMLNTMNVFAKLLSPAHSVRRWRMRKRCSSRRRFSCP
jgi:hypothetical protein